MAAAGMETILIHLVRDCGAEAANGLLAMMKTRFESGAFHSHEYLN
jgi:hypothetical protein